MFDFDLDELDEQLGTSKTLAVTPLDEAEFQAFDKSLGDALQKKDFALVGSLVSQALWSEQLLSERLPAVTVAFLEQVQAAIKRGDQDTSLNLTYMLFQLSLSISVHEVRCQEESGFNSPCVLMFGFGGSSLEELQPQANYYKGRGFKVLSAGPLSWPHALKDKQDATLVEELRLALADGNGQLVLHACSNSGITRAFSFLAAWSEGKGSFAVLSQPEACLVALVWECCPVRDPFKEDKQIESAKTNDADAQKADLAVVEANAMVIRGCITALCLKQRIDIGNFLSVDETNRLYKGAASSMMMHPPAWYQRSDVPHWDFDAFEDWDRQLAKPLPRLFLYSDTDMVIPREAVEAYIQHTENYNPQAKIVRKLVPNAQHCRLWGASAFRQKSISGVERLIYQSGINTCRI